jgi:hypothetical protein
MRLPVTIIFCMLSFSTLFAQLAVKDSLILTDGQNTRWLNRLEESDLTNKLAHIKRRLLADTAVYVRQPSADRISMADQYKYENRIEGSCKPILVFDGQLLYFTNTMTHQMVRKTADLLTNANVKDVIVIRDASAAAIYGSRASCGVLVFHLKNKKVKRKIKQLLREQPISGY